MALSQADRPVTRNGKAKAHVHGRSGQRDEVPKYRELLAGAQGVKKAFVHHMGQKYSQASVDSHLRSYFQRQNGNLTPELIDELLQDCRRDEGVDAIMLRRSLRGKEPGDAPILDLLEGKPISTVPDELVQGFLLKFQDVLQRFSAADESDSGRAATWPVQPPERWKAEGLPPIQSTERQEWDANNAQKKKAIDEERAKFADALINTIITRLKSDDSLQEAPSWNAPDVRPYAISQAVHGAIQQLCVKFVEKLTLDALDHIEHKEEKRRIEEEKREAEKSRKNKKKNKKNKRYGPPPSLDPTALTARVSKMNDYFESRREPVVRTSAEVRASRLTHICENMELRVRNILEDRRHDGGTEVVEEIADMTDATFGQILGSIRAVLIVEANDIFTPSTEDPMKRQESLQRRRAAQLARREKEAKQKKTPKSPATKKKATMPKKR